MTQSNQTEQKELEEVQSSHESLLHPQLSWKSRKFPKSPGLFPVPVDIVITNIMQLLLVFTNILVLLSSASIDYDKDTLGWIIFIMFIFTWIGFGLYIREIRKHAIIYRTFFKRVDICYYNENERLANNRDSSCFCLRCICIRVSWWLYALFIFPFIILWSVFKSYKHYRNQRKVSNDDVTTDITQINWDSNHNLDVNDQEQYLKIAETAYGVSHLGVLSKQASMIVCFIQDIPLLILCAIIGNKLGLVVYSIMIVLKLLFWVKYMVDVGRFTVFYKYEDYLFSFGLRSVTWETNTFGCSLAIPVFLTDIEKQKLLWDVRDYVKCLKDKESEEWVIMILFAIDSKKDQIIVADPSLGDENIDSVERLNEMIADQGAYRFNRWDEGIQPLSAEELIQFLETRKNDNNHDGEYNGHTQTNTDDVKVVVEIQSDINAVDGETKPEQRTEVDNGKEENKIDGNVTDREEQQ